MKINRVEVIKDKKIITWYFKNNFKTWKHLAKQERDEMKDRDKKVDLVEVGGELIYTTMHKNEKKFDKEYKEMKVLSKVLLFKVNEDV